MKIAFLAVTIAALGGQLVPVYAQMDTTRASAQSQGSSNLADLPGGVRERGQTEPALEEIIVTAQKIRQPAFDVPISLLVIGGKDFQRLGITDLTDLQAYVPGLSFIKTATGNLSVFLRGIANGSGTGAQVGAYLDDADIAQGASSSINVMSYDLARIEVLRGPQGTLYGEGSEAGTIHYVTNKPNLDRFQVDTDVTALFDQYGAPSDQVVAVVNAPIVKKGVGLRVAMDRFRDGGWVDQPAAGLKNVNSSDQTDVRVEGRLQPTEALTVDGMEVIHRARYGLINGESPVGYFTQNFGLTTTPHTETDDNISNVVVSWNTRAVRILNSATYVTWSSPYSNDAFSEQLQAPPKPLTEFYVPHRSQSYEDVNDELRLSHSGTGPWQWTIGVFYKHQTTRYGALAYFVGPAAESLPAKGLVLAGSELSSKSLSGFGDINYRFFGRLTLGIGARYFTDRQQQISSAAGSLPLKAKFTSVDPRVYVRYALSKHTNLYASAAKGFRSGGFNLPGQPPYEPEHVWTYELGAKYVSDRITGDTDVFVTKYGGYQAFGIVLSGPEEGTALIGNAGNVRVKGLEGDVVWRPMTSWYLGLNGEYYTSRFVNIFVRNAQYAVGDPADFVPRFQVTAFAEKEFSLGERGASARLDYSERAPVTFRERSVGPWFYYQSDYIYLLNFHSWIQWNPEVRLGMFVQNLLNDRGNTQVGFLLENIREQPRTFGVEFEFRYD